METRGKDGGGLVGGVLKDSPLSPAYLAEARFHSGTSTAVTV